MTLTAFELDLGTRQGRIPHPFDEGAFVVELGHADRIQESFGSYLQAHNRITQLVTLTASMKLIRARVRVRPHTFWAPPYRHWMFRAGWQGDGLIVFYERVLMMDGLERVFDDIAVSCVNLWSPIELVFELFLLDGAS